MSGGAYDIVVVGAGAAGIGAARRLAERRCEALVVEARDRVGGRAVTVATTHGPVDLGCEWLHSADRNPLTALAREHAFTVIEKLPDWGRLRRFDGDDARHAAWLAASSAFRARVAAATAEGPDRPAASLLEPGGRWNPLLDAISTWANGVELDRLSVQDYASYADSGINWRVREGYGSLIARLSAGLPVRLGVAVRQIDTRGRTIAVETTHGTLRARAVILTVPPTVLAADAIDFVPPLPAAKRAAVEGLPLGLANKLFLAVDAATDLPSDGHVLGATDRVATGNYLVRPHGQAMISAYFGGRLAGELEAAGPAAMTAFAVDELVGLYGGALRPRLRRVVSSAWAGDSWARGSYSFALPGHAGDRAVLAAAIDDRLFFAGEACSAGDFSTAHGAFRTGLAAADAAMGMRR
jgi:monoamine oxidase